MPSIMNDLVLMLGKMEKKNIWTDRIANQSSENAAAILPARLRDAGYMTSCRLLS